MNALVLFLGLSLPPAADAPSQQQPSSTTQTTRPGRRQTPMRNDTTNRRRDRRLRPDSLRRGGATRVDTVR